MFATMKQEPFLKYIALVRDRIPSFDEYPFSIPAIRQLDQLELNPKVTFFAGENGSGKSTLLEAIALVEGLNAEGGSRNFSFSTRESHSVLCQFLRLGRGRRPLRKADAFFFRSESFYNVATEAERLGVAYGDKSLHEQSHGESFLSLILNRFFGNGLYILDEPEAALSPARQLSLIRAMYELVEDGSQFIVATQSPIVLGYPNATIYWLSNSGIAPIQYTETEHFKVTRSFVTQKDRMLKELLSGEIGQDEK
jgi:predicted ATPase